MKTRKHRKREWWFYPPKGSKISRGRCYTFKRKADMMCFINGHLPHAVNGSVHLEESSFAGSYAIRSYNVWYKAGVVDLRRVMHRKPFKVEKGSKRWFSHSNQAMEQMLAMQDGYSPQQAKNLVKTFYKMGFDDFEPDAESWEYINGHIERGIDFYHWSDRCNRLRMKTIIEMFKRQYNENY